MTNSTTTEPTSASGYNQLTYALDGFWREHGDPRMRASFPLMAGGPAPVLAIMAAYLCFVRYLGPKLMESRAPLDLKRTIRTYNLVIGLANLVGFCRAAVLMNLGTSYFGCKPVGRGAPEESELIAWGYLCFLGKLVELADTVFFVLRKKHNQASNLHIFHHGLVPVVLWTYLKIAPAGSSAMFPFLNAGVHALMYGYYYLATFEGLQRSLWWKRHLTELQILQFVISMMHFSAVGLASCQYPRALAAAGFLLNLIFLVLFCDFYYRSYSKSSSRCASPVAQKKIT